MGQTYRLSDLAHGRNNKFDVIRLLAAVAVIYTHGIALSQGGLNNEIFKTILGLSPGDIGVDVFFVTSGYLVTTSYFSRGNPIDFLWARFLRIYPALIVAVLLTVILGLIFTSWDTVRYLESHGTWRYVAMNMTLLFGIEHGLPGVFFDAPFGAGLPYGSGYVNGSLWTLPYEVRLYLMLAIIGAAAFLWERGNKLILVRVMIITMGVIAFCGLLAGQSGQSPPLLGENGWRFMSMFFLGSTLQVIKSRIILSWHIFILSILFMVVIILLFDDLAYVIYAAFLPYWVMCLAYLPLYRIRPFGINGDYSYGLYIYHWPVMQSIVDMWAGISWYMLTFVGASITFFLAYMSWHYVEKRALKHKELLNRGA